MTTERWTRAHELFDQALRLPAAERAAFLSHACPDEDLRREVQSLLNHDTAAGETFLDPTNVPLPCDLPPEGDPPGDPPSTAEAAEAAEIATSEGVAQALPSAAGEAHPTADGDANSSVPAGQEGLHSTVAVRPHPDTGTPRDPLIGRRIGRYHIKAVVASGRLATVYEATQEQPHRVVAVKVLNAGVASPSALRRFQFESQLLARLRHPNVAQVYEAGIHVDGGLETPFFAMEYIPGARPITDYAAARGLSIRARLELFARVCDAVDHGHQRGIIHRDLKPANILVDAAGEPKVIDFGVARATDSDMAATAQQTCVGQIVGTLQYMSPEQCDGDPHGLDTRSDVYSLGVVLYELLTGQPPYDASTTTVYHAVRIIRECEPLPPSQAVAQQGQRPSSGGLRRRYSTGERRFASPARELRGAVDAIVLKALAKTPEKRYASAADLARDIRRHLRGDPVEARPPTAWAKAIRWIGRHPLLITGAAGCLIVVLTFVTTIWSVWLLNYRPHHVQLVANGRVARLETVLGVELACWTSADEQPIVLAQLVPRPVHLGGGKIVVLGARSVTEITDDKNFVYLIEPERNPYQPWRRLALDPNDKVPYKPRYAEHEERDYRPARFLLHMAIIAEVFRELEGPEIVVVFLHRNHTQSIIRVYDFDGRVRYEIWHDASLNSCCACPQTGLLVFSGLNGEAYWYERGEYQLSLSHPRVVFAIRPRLDTFIHEYMSSEAGEATDTPVWYGTIYPLDFVHVCDPRSENPRQSGLEFWLHPPTYGGVARLELRVNKGGGIAGGVSWELDANGREVQYSRLVSDLYRKLRRDDPNTYPDPNEFRLGPLPPIVSRSTTAPAAADGAVPANLP